MTLIPRSSRLGTRLPSVVLLMSNVFCGGEDPGSVGSERAPVPPIVRAGTVLWDGEINPGLAAPTAAFLNGFGEFDVELLYKLHGLSEDFYPLPEGAILEHVPEQAYLDRHFLRGLEYSIDQPMIVLADLRPLTDECTPIVFGVRIVGPDVKVQPLGQIWSWPHSKRAQMEVEVTGDGEFALEREGDHFYVDVPLRNDAPPPTVVTLGRVVPTDEVPDPDIGCYISDGGRGWSSMRRPRREGGWPLAYEEVSLTIRAPGEATVSCIGTVFSFRHCERVWDVPRPDITTTATVTIRAYYADE